MINKNISTTSLEIDLHILLKTYQSLLNPLVNQIAEGLKPDIKDFC